VAPARHSFDYHGFSLVYDDYVPRRRGDAPTVILMPGLLFSRTMHQPLARTLCARGYRVLCLDLLGHGASDRPEEMWNYSMVEFGAQTLALMDHVGVERAVLGGTSLGANTTLEAAVAAPDRVQGMLIEMPVLDNALLGCAISFTPLLLSLTFGAPVTRAWGRLASLVPRRGPLLGQMLLDWLSQDPKPSASLVQGLFFGRVAPPRAERKTLTAPTLIIGHARDPIHPFSDADMLAGELRDARMIRASSILELRTTPERLTKQIVKFVDDCWGGKPPRQSAGGRGSANGSADAGQARRRPA
jgi:pimeloyl-ACP methyl ester carboxylesterase